MRSRLLWSGLGLLVLSSCATAPVAGVIVGEDRAPLHRVFVQVTTAPECNAEAAGECTRGGSDEICEVISDLDGQFMCASLRGVGDSKVRLKPEQLYQVRFEKEGYKTHCYCVVYDRELEPQRIQLPFRSSSMSPIDWPVTQPPPPASDAPGITTHGS